MRLNDEHAGKEVELQELLVEKFLKHGRLYKFE